MKRAISQVRAFQKAKGLHTVVALPTSHGSLLDTASAQCAYDAAHLLHAIDQAPSTSQRHLRGSMLLEEVGEALAALAVGDEELLLDALADIVYVAVGTAIVFDLPLCEAFDEVHRSNMTKSEANGDLRLADKGRNFVPPDLAAILKEKRCAKQ